MKTEELYTMIQQKPVILDGATGSNLQKVGMKPGVCPEEWILENEDKLIDLQKSFVAAGTNILYAPTFSGNRVKLEEYGLADRAKEINKRLVGLSKRAAGDKALVAGDMTMTGVALEPVGPMKLEALIDIYKEQAKYLLEAGVDLFVVETMMRQEQLLLPLRKCAIFLLSLLLLFRKMEELYMEQTQSQQLLCYRALVQILSV